MKRAHISLKIKLAAALLHMKRYVGDGEWENIISSKEAPLLTADQIIARFHFDHYPIPHAEGGPDEPWNLDPVPTADHKKKTATIDVPGIAKRKRVAQSHIEHTRTMATPRDQRQPKQSRWASRPFRKKGISK